MEIIKEWWGAIGAIFGLAVWFVRLEAGMLTNRKDIRRIEDDRREDKKTTNKQFDSLGKRFDEVGSDIKQILILMNSKADR